LNDEIYMINGVHGCGFHIEPKKWIGFNLKSKASETIEVCSCHAVSDIEVNIIVLHTNEEAQLMLYDYYITVS
uniref:TLDc domain-containing protein n=1 Tax=Anisakis simplex TaxID=6269 RepID=A0A0M3JHF9_ANISI